MRFAVRRLTPAATEFQIFRQVAAAVRRRSQRGGEGFSGPPAYAGGYG